MLDNFIEQNEKNKGVYIILNIKNLNYYLGSTSRTFIIRKTQHLSDLKRNKHRNIYLQRAVNKHGIENFMFLILEEIEEDSEIIKKEQFYMDNCNPKYNIQRECVDTRKGVKHKKETLKLLSEKLKGKPAWNKNKPFGIESRKKMSDAKKGKKPNRAYEKGTSNLKVIRSDGKVYKNAYYAAMDLNVKPNTITKAITDKNKFRQVKGFQFKYENTNFKVQKEINYIQKNGNKFVVRKHGEFYLGRFDTYEEAKIAYDTFKEKRKKALDKKQKV